MKSGLRSRRVARGLFTRELTLAILIGAAGPVWVHAQEPSPPRRPAAVDRELEKAEEELAGRLADLEESQQALEESRQRLATARAALDEVLGSDEKEQATAAEEVARAEDLVAAAQQETAARREAYDRALGRYRLAQREFELQRLDQIAVRDEEASESIAAVLGSRSRAEQSRLKAELAEQRTLALQNELVAIEQEQARIRRFSAQLGEQLRSPLSQDKRRELEDRRRQLDRQDEDLVGRVVELRQELLEAKVEQRIKEEDALLRAEDYSRWISRLLYTAAVVGVLLLSILLARRVATRRIPDLHRRYSFNKALSLLATLVVAGGVVFVFADSLPRIATGLGVAVAGVAIAMQEAIASFFAWFFIRGARGYQTGHFVQIGDQYGEVIDIGWLLTVLRQMSPLEEDGTAGGSPTGAISLIGNSAIFKVPVVNFSRGIPFVWCALRHVVTFESDWRRAEQWVREALAAEKEIESTADQARRRLRQMAGEFAVHQAGTEPQFWVRAATDGVELTARFLVHPSRRRALLDQVERRILDAFDADPEVTLAYKTLRTIPTPPQG